MLCLASIAALRRLSTFVSTITAIAAIAALMGCEPKPVSPSDAGARDAGMLGDSNVAGDASMERGVRIEGRRLFVDGTPFQVRGVCWNPVGEGGTHPADLDFAGFVSTDAPLMAAAGINVVRTYEPLTDRNVLDALYALGIYVIDTVYAYGGDDPANVAARVRAVADHPAVLMWVIGNEWNYNGFYTGLSHADSVARVADVAARIRAVDDSHPIATAYGELPSSETLAALPGIDVWGINVYRGISFGDLFDVFAARSSLPMFIAEYGADAWNANLPGEDLSSQAEATTALTNEILAASSAARAEGVCLGGTLFEWADEWWKDGAGSPLVHDTGGTAPGGGPHPDGTFNEEWWGIVDIDRNPRPAYQALAAIYDSP